MILSHINDIATNILNVYCSKLDYIELFLKHYP